ncbi:protein kinase domain-containing protein [Candidatus Protofrankia californiensis]|uniref:protein kinase domain-containing protein n=1 Tax=Candidatus Protofrankia californiensis TaxID=1839754 RepID=UPI00104123F4|nr:protein kinase [Candidatus Protofrankia californiensis]
MQPLRSDDPTQVGPYKLVGRLGAGGMGRVYLGRSPAGRAIAVKVVRPELADNPEFRDRFAREVQAAQAVSGAYTAAVIDADPTAERPWLATAYVPGLSLAETVRRTGPLPQTSVKTLAAGLAEALAAVHRAGLVHRDLKPSNVLLATDGPKVIDFGISRAADATGLTQTGGVLGSPGFMAPEQITGGEIGPPCDVFALGALIAFAATGREPFGTGPTPALVYRLVHSEPTLDGIDGDLRELVTACLAKDPAARPGLAAVLARLTDQDEETAVLRPGPGWLPPPVIDVLLTYAAAPAAAHPSDAGQPPPAAPAPPAPATPASASGDDRGRGSDEAAAPAPPAMPAPAPASVSASETSNDGPHANLGPGDIVSPAEAATAQAEAATARPVTREPAVAPATSQTRRRRRTLLMIGGTALVAALVAISIGLAIATSGPGRQLAAAGDAQPGPTTSVAHPAATADSPLPDPSANTSAGASPDMSPTAATAPGGLAGGEQPATADGRAAGQPAPATTPRAGTDRGSPGGNMPPPPPVAGQPPPAAHAFNFAGNLSRYSCADEGRLASARTTDGVQVTFDNQSPETVQIYWLDFDGSRVAYAPSLAAGNAYSSNTYVNHLWLVANSNGRCLGIFTAGNTGGRITVH